jgi:hypothetical protein
MKSKLLLAIVIILLTGTIKGQVPNGDFENWTAMTGYDIPVGWDNLNALTASKNVFTCEKGIQAGNSYLRLVSDSVQGIGVAPGIAICGTLDPITLKPKSGFPYTKRPSALSGKWQFMAPGDDRGFIAVYFSKWNSVSKKREIIGSGVDTLDGMEMAWANFSIPISFSNSAAPDSCIIFISASSSIPLQYSYLFVDDLLFETSSGILDDSRSATNFTFYPNPAVDLLKLDLHSLQNIQSIQITNIQGQVLYSRPYDLNVNEIDVSNLSPGIYLICVKSKDGLSTKKLDKF